MKKNRAKERKKGQLSEKRDKQSERKERARKWMPDPGNGGGGGRYTLGKDVTCGREQGPPARNDFSQLQHGASQEHRHLHDRRTTCWRLETAQGPRFRHEIVHTICSYRSSTRLLFITDIYIVRVMKQWLQVIKQNVLAKDLILNAT
jgi:hypothetical protein